MAGGSSGSLLMECIRELKTSSHDFEKLLGSSVEDVWRALATNTERQLRLKKGANIPPLGKFAFIRDLQPLSAVFVLADRFISRYSASWRRPPPSLLTPAADLNMSVVGVDAGGVPKDLVVKTLDAIVAFIGVRLQKGLASGRLPFGQIGTFSLEGKAITFAFDGAFVKSVAGSSTSLEPTETKSRLQQKNVPRALSLQALATEMVPVDTVENADEQTKNVIERQEKHSRRHKSHSRRNGSRESQPRQSKSTGQLLPLVDDAHMLPRSTSTHEGLQILPLFMLPAPDCASVHKRMLEQSSSLQRAFEVKAGELHAQLKESAQQDDEIARRTRATRLRCVQEKATKTVNQRDLDAFLNSQIEWKLQEKLRGDALDACATNYDIVGVLPRDPLVTKEQRHAAKLKLRDRLHSQVSLKDTLERQRKEIDRAESAFFMSKVQEQAAREQELKREQQRIARDALTEGWHQQRTVHEQCELLHPTRIHEQKR